MSGLKKQNLNKTLKRSCKQAINSYQTLAKVPENPVPTKFCGNSVPTKLCGISVPVEALSEQYTLYNPANRSIIPTLDMCEHLKWKHSRAELQH